MRILHVLDHSIPIYSGYSFRTLSILRQQRALGWETAHLTGPKHPGSPPPVDRVGDLEFYRTTGDSGRRVPVLGEVEVVRRLRRRLREVIGEVVPDVVHAHSPSLNGLAALMVSRQARTPLVYEVRALWEDGAVSHGTARGGGWRYRASRALETYVLRRCDAVTTICEGLRREIISRGIDARRVTVIPNAVDTQRFVLDIKPDEALAAALGLRGGPTLGFIGSFYGYEGLRVLLRALPEILAHRPDVQVVLVGGGDEETNLKKLARELGVANQVVFTGWVPHDTIDRYYNVLDVMVYPRELNRVTELVTPLKPLESMAVGRLVIASDVGGHRELVRHGATGLLFQAGNHASLAATVSQALDEPERTRTIRLAARRFVEEERTWSASVARYQAVYERLAKRRR